MTTSDRYQGDPRLITGDNGVTISIKGGQPVMDQGLENYALIQLLTEKGWWGNTLFANKYERIGSDFTKTAHEASTIAALVKIQSAGKVALKDMVETKVAKETTVTARNPEGSRAIVSVVIEPPGKDLLTLTATKHGANWIAQKENPAYERI